MSRSLREGEVVDGRLEVCEERSDSLLDVFVCYDRISKEMVVLQTLKDKYMMSNGASEQFIKFANDWIALGTHKNIVRARSVFDINGKPYLCVDYVPPMHSVYGYMFLWKIVNYTPLKSASCGMGYMQWHGMGHTEA